MQISSTVLALAALAASAFASKAPSAYSSHSASSSSTCPSSSSSRHSSSSSRHSSSSSSSRHSSSSSSSSSRSCASSSYRDGCLSDKKICATVRKVEQLTTPIPYPPTLELAQVAKQVNGFGDWFSYYSANDLNGIPNPLAAEFAAQYNVNVTVVSSDGTVFADTRLPAANLANHNTRYEIFSALTLKQIQCTQRPSRSTGINSNYCSAPLFNNQTVAISVRVERSA